MTPTREETLLAELEALKASIPDVARKAREEALEEADAVCGKAFAEAIEEVSRSLEGTSHGVYWAGKAVGAALVKSKIRALKSKEAK